MYGSSRTSRTFLTVRQAGGRPLEVIEGGQFSWRFRPHFHAGDEIVRLLAGRARLRLPTGCREIAEGDTVVVPAGMVHRFEPVDDKGWAFASEFVLRPADTPPAGSADGHAAEGLARQAMMRLADRGTLRTDVDVDRTRLCRVAGPSRARLPSRHRDKPAQFPRPAGGSQGQGSVAGRRSRHRGCTRWRLLRSGPSHARIRADVRHDTGDLPLGLEGPLADQVCPRPGRRRAASLRHVHHTTPFHPRECRRPPDLLGRRSMPGRDRRQCRHRRPLRPVPFDDCRRRRRG